MYSFEVEKVDTIFFDKLKLFTLEIAREYPCAFNKRYEQLCLKDDKYWISLLEQNSVYVVFNQENIISLITVRNSLRINEDDIIEITQNQILKEYYNKQIIEDLIKYVIQETKGKKHIKKIKAYLKPDKILTEKIYKKLGFKYKETLKGKIKLKYKYCDLNVFELDL